MIFSATYELVSKSCPGVTVTLRRMGRKRRASVELQVSGARAKCRDLAQASAKVNANLQGALDAVPGYRDALLALPHKDGEIVGDLPPSVISMVPDDVWLLVEMKNAAQVQASAIEQSEIFPAYIASAVESIKGIDGGLTAEALCDSGPDELFDEVIAAINSNGYRTVEQTENLSQPTTSGVRVDGKPTITTAPLVSHTSDSTST